MSIFILRNVFECSKNRLRGDRLLKLIRSSSKSTKQFVVSPLAKDLADFSHIPLERIRNFSIIAHVDHGKSTLADRILEITGTISADSSNKQVLDQLQVERERGITVKAQTASILHEHNGEQYLLNLIDTPGHVDFSHEVSRSLLACQGVILLVDANKGVQAQTVANFYLAFASDLAIVPVLNKIDLKTADPDRVAGQMHSLFECTPDTILRVSAKTGEGVSAVLDSVVTVIPAPSSHCQLNAPLRALVFDSWHEKYRGCIPLVAVVDGRVTRGQRIRLNNGSYEVREVGFLRPHKIQAQHLSAGQVGYVVANIRSPADVIIGDTMSDGAPGAPPVEPLAGLRSAVPMVYAGIYPMDQSEVPALRSAIERLSLNDSSVSVRTESSMALGQGWRLGFLGLLHMEVFTQRLQQEHESDVVVTAPSVPYLARMTAAYERKHHCAELSIKSAADFPDVSSVTEFLEPVVDATIITPSEHFSVVQSMVVDRRGSHPVTTNIDDSRLMMRSRLPLSEVVVDFFDALKSLSSGYASFDYEEAGYQTSELCRLDFLLNSIVVEELALVVHKSRARSIGRSVCGRLLETIPRQQFKVVIQAAIGSKILAREEVKPFRKDVTAKCYGGDISRRMKLLRFQAEGKKRMRRVANIDLPRETFIKVLKR